MDLNALLLKLAVGEDVDLELKLARGGIPGSLWESYSAMANTDGGVILLGISDDGDVRGLPDVNQARRQLWDGINNREKVSRNLLGDADIQQETIGSNDILVMKVPRAGRHQRPIFVGPHPFTGTYRRNYEGDYKCTEDEVRRMLADADAESRDARILSGFGMDDLDERTLTQYRNRFSHRSPNLPWLAEDEIGMLRKLGGWRRDRRTGRDGLTIAGLVMFGRQETITDPDALPGFIVDLRERLSDDPAVRWTDRLTTDGTWAGNLFQFYQQALPRLTRDLRVPFQLDPDLFRQDETPVHEAIREAVVNALIHADYRGAGGVVIEKYRDRIEISNPGSLLVSFSQLLIGGVSECRNKSLQLMFQMIGGGEKAGSGMDKIRRGWGWSHWRAPSIREQVQPDRVRLVMPMVSLLPTESINRLRSVLGKRLDRLTPEETQALVTAEVEGAVSNSRLQELSHDHPTDITRLLQSLTARGFLAQKGCKRGAHYALSDELEATIPTTDSTHKTGDSTHKTGDSTHKTGDSTHKTGDSTHKADPGAEHEMLRLLAVPVSESKRSAPEIVRRVICSLCRERFLTAEELGDLLKRNPRGLGERYLRPMLKEGLLKHQFPNEPNRPDQAYTTNDRTAEL